MSKLLIFVIPVILSVLVTSIFLLLTVGNNAFAIEYTNYISEKYGIQFEYPSDWTVTERTSRFDIGDIKIESGSLTFFIIDRHEHYRTTVEYPSYITIDSLKAGTYLVSLTYNAALQQWFVLVGNYMYQIMDFEPINDFDSPENTEIRNHFINSIKFLGDIESQQKSKLEYESEFQADDVKKQIGICCTWGMKLVDGILMYEINNAKSEHKELVIAALKSWEEKIKGIKFKEAIDKESADIKISFRNDNGKVAGQTMTNFDSEGFIFNAKILLAEKSFGKKLNINFI